MVKERGPSFCPLCVFLRACTRAGSVQLPFSDVIAMNEEVDFVDQGDLQLWRYRYGR